MNPANFSWNILFLFEIAIMVVNSDKECANKVNGLHSTGTCQNQYVHCWNSSSIFMNCPSNLVYNNGKCANEEDCINAQTINKEIKLVPELRFDDDGYLQNLDEVSLKPLEYGIERATGNCRIKCVTELIDQFIGSMTTFGGYTWLSSYNVKTCLTGNSCPIAVGLYPRYENPEAKQKFNAATLKCYPGGSVTWHNGETLQAKCSALFHLIPCVTDKLFHTVPAFDRSAFLSTVCEAFYEFRNQAQQDPSIFGYSGIPTSCRELIEAKSICN